MGSRSLADHLTTPEAPVGRDRVRRLMLIMGIESLAPKPGTSKRQPKHPVYPYLLRGMTLKYERIYLKTYETGTELFKDLTIWFTHYNEERKHSSLDKRTPNEAYSKGLEDLRTAA
jgi:transposase InsO family protein